MHHFNIIVIYPWVAQHIERLKNGFVRRKPVKQRQIAPGCSGVQEPFQDRPEISERTIRRAICAGDDVVNPALLQWRIDDLSQELDSLEQYVANDGPGG